MKRILLMLTLALVALAGCKKEPAPEPIAGKVSQIKLVGMPTEFTVGRSFTISAVITPDDATDKSVTFSSSNPEVATVEYIESEYNYSLALLKAVGPGKATITATANDGSGVKAEAEVTVILKKTTFASPANCYIVTKAGKYTFKAVKGNSSESVGNVASAEVLWESFGTHKTPEVGDLVRDVSYKDGEITFRATDEKGNAVIAAKDADGNILWSWHIWLTDQPVEHVYKNNAGTMMDRNLGATSVTSGDVRTIGLLYQWGRKDPFLGAVSFNFYTPAKSTITWPSAVEKSSSTGNIAYAIAHPTTFIFIEDIRESCDWTDMETESRWTTSDRTKSIYDPCPAGWRVPDGGEDGVWAKAGFFDNNFFGIANKEAMFYISSSTTAYPLAGYRDYEGDIQAVSTKAYYWSACRTSIQGAHSLMIDKEISQPGVLAACGMSVRCAKE